jgi:hypothetical protein
MTERILGLDEVLEDLLNPLEDSLKPKIKPDEETLYSEYMKSLSEKGKKIIEFEYGEDIVKKQIKEYLETHEDLVERPKILLPTAGRPDSVVAEEIGKHFNDKDLLFYRPAERCVVRLEMIPVKKEDSDKKIIGFKDVSPYEFITLVEKYLDFGIKKGNKEETEEDEFVSKSMSVNTAKIILESPQFKDSLPIIETIFTVPIPILKEGRLIFPNPGYDPKLQSWLSLDAPQINPNMSLEEAKSLILGIYDEFCFRAKDDGEKLGQDKTNAIAGLVTGYIRGLYPRPGCRTPVELWLANKPGAGKDYGANIPNIAFDGTSHSEPAICDTKNNYDEEFKKRVTANLIQGKQRILSSNNKGYLNSATLERVSTSETIEDRILGHSKNISGENIMEFVLTANEPFSFSTDFPRRARIINLFLPIEDPNTRKFQNWDLHGWVLKHRSDIISALYALVRNWHEKGMPPGKTLFSSFPDWARVCGGIMEAAALGDPCLPNNISTIGGDRETRDMKRLFELCYNHWPNEWKLKSEITAEIMKPDSDFGELFAWFEWSKDERSAKTKFAFVLERYVNSQFSGIEMTKTDEERAARRKYKWSKIEEEKSKEVQETGGNVGNVGNV